MSSSHLFSFLAAVLSIFPYDEDRRGLAAIAQLDITPKGVFTRGSLMTPKAVIWSGELDLRGFAEDMKIDIDIYSLGTGPTARPPFPNQLLCDVRNLQNSTDTEYLAKHMRNATLALLQPQSTTGADVSVMKTVAELLEGHGEHVLQKCMVMADYGPTGKIGLYVLYERV